MSYNVFSFLRFVTTYKNDRNNYLLSKRQRGNTKQSKRLRGKSKNKYRKLTEEKKKKQENMKDTEIKIGLKKLYKD